MLKVVAADPAQRERAAAIALKLKVSLLPIEEVAAEEGQLLLWVSDKGIGLKPSGRRGPNPVYVDFLSAALEYRKKQSSFRNELVAKAVAVKPDEPISLVDATAGFGRDSFILASLGCRITMLEKNAVVALVLKDGLARAAEDPGCATAIARMDLVEGDAIEYLNGLEEDRPQVIYLDPMFPVRQKSAKVKKEMQVLQLLLGHEEKSNLLLTTALRCTGKRVVVKRPAHAPYLEDITPNHSIKGRSSRFDVYLRNL